MATAEQPLEFSLVYDGEAVRDGRMAVRDLAPALLALRDLFHESNTVVNPEGPPVNLEIGAFGRGSFDVYLYLAAQSFVSLFSSDPAVAVATAKELVELVVGTDRGLLTLIKRLRGQRPVRREPSAVQGTTRLVLADGTSLETPNSVVVMLERPTIRKNAREVLRPLEREGVDEV